LGFYGVIKYEELEEKMKKAFRKLGFFNFERIFSLRVFKMALINAG